MQQPPIFTASESRRVLAGYHTSLALHVEDAAGEPLPLDGARVTAALSRTARMVGKTALDVEPAGAGALRVLLPEASLAPHVGRQATLGVRLHLGAGVIYEVQAALLVEEGRAEVAEGEEQEAPALTVRIVGEEPQPVEVAWAAIRDLGAAIQAAEALEERVGEVLPEIEGARDGALDAISQAGGAAVEAVEATGGQAVEGVEEAGGQALSDLSQATQAGIEALEQQEQASVAAVEQAETTTITQATQAGVSALQQQEGESTQALANRQQQAEQAVQQAEGEAVETVEGAAEDAVEAVEGARDSALGRVEQEGDTQVNRLYERVPDASAEPDNRILITRGEELVYAPDLALTMALTGGSPQAWEVYETGRRSFASNTNAFGLQTDSGHTWVKQAGEEADSAVLEYRAQGLYLSASGGGGSSHHPGLHGCTLLDWQPTDLRREVSVHLEAGGVKHWGRHLILSWVDAENYLVVIMSDYHVRVRVRIGGGEERELGRYWTLSGGFVANHYHHYHVLARVHYVHAQPNVAVDVLFQGEEVLRVPLDTTEQILIDSPGRIGVSAANQTYLHGLAARQLY